MTTKRYELLRDLPDLKASPDVIFQRIGNISMPTHAEYSYSKDGKRWYYPIELVESNPDFFREVVEKDWEIQCFTDGKRNWWINKDGLFKNMPFDSGMDEGTMLLIKEMKIWQVKRKTDQEIFSVGDRIDHEWSKIYVTDDKIKKIQLDGNQIHLVGNDWSSLLQYAKKLHTHTKQFEWTDELVNEFVRKLKNGEFHKGESNFKQFKASKQNTNEGK